MTAQIVDLAHYRSMGLCQGHRTASRASNVAELRTDRRSPKFGPERRLMEHRSEPRHEIEGWCSPRLTLNGKSAVIKNVSRHGLMAATEMNAVAGSRMLATLAGSRPISARVIWRDGSYVGLDLPIEWLPAIV